MSPQGRIFTAIAVTAGIAAVAVLGVVFRESLFTFLGLAPGQSEVAKEVVSNATINTCEADYVEIDGLTLCAENLFTPDACLSAKRYSANGQEGFFCVDQGAADELEALCGELGGTLNNQTFECTLPADASPDQQDGVDQEPVFKAIQVQLGTVPTATLAEPIDNTIAGTTLQTLPVTCEKNQEEVKDAASGAVTACETRCPTGMVFNGEQNGQALCVNEITSCQPHQSETLDPSERFIVGCENQCAVGEQLTGFTGTQSVGATTDAPAQTSEIGTTTAVPSEIVFTPVCEPIPSTGTTTTQEQPKVQTPGVTQTQETPTQTTTTQTQVTPIPTQTTTTTSQGTQTSTKPAATATAAPLSTTGNEKGFAMIAVALALILGGVIAVRVGKRA